jgi:serine/threonine protein kinase
MKSGQHIGRFELDEMVGKGGMAEIFRATERLQSGSTRTVAIKRLFAKLAADHQYVEMFVNEASISARMRHPNIVRTYGLLNYQGYYYIVMEYLAGIDLDELLSNHASESTTLTIPQAAFIAHEITEGLAYAHQGGAGSPIVHRDISPGNILIGGRGEVKIADFGIAKVLQAVSQTLPGVIKGTYEYMAPEYVKGLPFDGRADLFSLGVVLYQMLTGVSPFAATEPRDIWERVLRFDPPPPSRFSPGVPPALDEVVSKALTKSPKLRFSSAQEMAEGLEPFFDEIGSSRIARQLAEHAAQAIQKQEHNASQNESRDKDNSAERANQEIDSGELLDLIEPVDDSHTPASKASHLKGPLPSVPESRRSLHWLWVALPLAVLVLTTLVLLLWPQSNGLLSVTSDLSANVSIDGQLVGTTPLRLSLPEGKHEVELSCITNDQTNYYQVIVSAKQEMQLRMKCKKPSPQVKVKKKPPPPAPKKRK